jgi:ferritin-like metal-binding protein YciE
MTDYKATSDHWNQVQKCADVVGSSDCSAILELRARVEALEAAAHKHIVETNSNIVALFTRVESLEAAERQASKVYEISKPLKLTAKQQEELNALLRSNSKPSPNSSQIGSSLVERVEGALMESVKEQGSMARAAIREVALWLDENTGGDAAWMLNQEAER